MSRHLYTLLWLPLLPLALLRLFWRGRREAGYRAHLGERLARHEGAAGFADAWWIHAVSVGETRAAQPLVRALLARDPAARVLITQMTPTGRQTAAEIFAANGPRVRVAYLPYDLPWLMRRFLRAFRPRALLLMETEIWPNLLHEARAGGVPAVLANARLSQRSARRYARLGRFARATFGCLDAVAAQSADDAGRLEALGARHVRVTGSVKFDVEAPPDTAAVAGELRAMIGARRTILAASTREGEEEAILAAFLRRAAPDDVLLLVPRHPQRFDLVAELVRRGGGAVQKRSAGTPLAAGTRVLLGDSMGEMFAYYSAADVALIGGSWLPLGGQNLIEACAVGTPVISGPHSFNFDEITRLAIEAGAAIRAADAEAGLRAAIELLDDPPRRAAMAAAGRAFAERHRGATRRTLEVLDEALARPG